MAMSMPILMAGMTFNLETVPQAASGDDASSPFKPSSCGMTSSGLRSIQDSPTQMPSFPFSPVIRKAGRICEPRSSALKSTHSHFAILSGSGVAELGTAYAARGRNEKSKGIVLVISCYSFVMIMIYLQMEMPAISSCCDQNAEPPLEGGSNTSHIGCLRPDAYSV